MLSGSKLETLTLGVLKRWDEWSGTRGYTVLDTDCRLLYSIVWTRGYTVLDSDCRLFFSIVWNEEMRSDEMSWVGDSDPGVNTD
jgi:hypothetical protein